MFERKTTYYTIVDEGRTPPSIDFGQIFSIVFNMHDDVVEEKRQVYSFWDYIGDIGGLNDFLQMIGSILMSLYSTFRGSGLDKHLVEKLFFTEKETKSGKLRR